MHMLSYKKIVKSQQQAFVILLIMNHERYGVLICTPNDFECGFELILKLILNVVLKKW